MTTTQTKSMNRLQAKYRKEVAPALMKEFGYVNALEVPKVQRVVVNVGIGKMLQSEPKAAELVASTLSRITGQRPVFTKSKKSISNFKVRQGQVIGVAVTLRGKRMYEFLDKLVSSTLPRVRDFRGLKLTAFDGHGNYSLGMPEHIVFPEIKSDEVEKVHGLEINVSTTARNNKEGLALLTLLGFPFQKPGTKEDAMEEKKRDKKEKKAGKGTK